ncbi:MAG: hypothetical protein RLZ10_691, partial [Bacteroidota bacterium]
MNKVCVCIEGQLRGAAHCGPTIKKYLIDKFNADLYFVVQNYEKHNSDNFKYYGKSVKQIVYDNPLPNFTQVFDKL